MSASAKLRTCLPILARSVQEASNIWSLGAARERNGHPQAQARLGAPVALPPSDLAPALEIAIHCGRRISGCCEKRFYINELFRISSQTVGRFLQKIQT